MLSDSFGFAEHQEQATYGLGKKLTLTRVIDTAVLNKDNAINDAKTRTNSFYWQNPQYIPSIPEQAILSRHFSSKTPRNLQYIERSVFLEEVKSQKEWKFQIFKLGLKKT